MQGSLIPSGNNPDRCLWTDGLEQYSALKKNTLLSGNAGRPWQCGPEQMLEWLSHLGYGKWGSR